MWVYLCLLTLCTQIWTNTQHWDFEQNNCTYLKVKNDPFIKANGKYVIDPRLHSLYKYNSFVAYPVFRHVSKNRIIFYIGPPFHWVIGKQQYLFSGQYWYKNKNPYLVNPWVTSLGVNNLSVTCFVNTTKTDADDTAGILQPQKIMIVISVMKLFNILQVFRNFP